MVAFVMVVSWLVGCVAFLSDKINVNDDFHFANLFSEKIAKNRKILGSIKDFHAKKLQMVQIFANVVIKFARKSAHQRNDFCG
jgi:hypothetical protein